VALPILCRVLSPSLLSVVPRGLLSGRLDDGAILSGSIGRAWTPGRDWRMESTSVLAEVLGRGSQDISWSSWVEASSSSQ
jgi:hypothetical protein